MRKERGMVLDTAAVCGWLPRASVMGHPTIKYRAVVHPTGADQHSRLAQSAGAYHRVLGVLARVLLLNDVADAQNLQSAHETRALRHLTEASTDQY